MIWIFVWLLRNSGSSQQLKPQELFHPDSLTNERRVLDLLYIPISCTCANWIDTLEDDGKHEISDLAIYLERKDTSLIDAYCLYDGVNIPIVVQVSGYYYRQKGWPKGWETHQKGFGDSARVFRYDKIKILMNGRSTKN